MLGTLLKLFRPTYALTALILFGGWQGYDFVKSVPEKLNLPMQLLHHPAEMIVEVNEPAVESAQVVNDPNSLVASNRFVAGIQNRSSFGRMLSWMVLYTLLCFAGAPVIKRVLAMESNTANGLLVVGFSGIGIFWAIVFMAFQFSFFANILLLLATFFSVGMIVWVTSELEHMRIEETFSCS